MIDLDNITKESEIERFSNYLKQLVEENESLKKTVKRQDRLIKAAISSSGTLLARIAKNSDKFDKLVENTYYSYGFECQLFHKCDIDSEKPTKPLSIKEIDLYFE
jgi:hypothetical protein